MCIPKLPTGFHLNIYDDEGTVKVASFRPLSGGGFCPAHVAGVDRGDTLSRINGDLVTGKTFQEVCSILGAITRPFVYLRFLRAGLESELRPNMVVIHGGGPNLTAPGDPSSRFRGVFERGGKYEAAVCLHASTSLQRANMAQLGGQPQPGLYVVHGVFDDEETAARAYDRATEHLGHTLTNLVWPHLGRRFSPFESKVYFPRGIVQNFGYRGFYQDPATAAGWGGLGGTVAGRPKTPAEAAAAAAAAAAARGRGKKSKKSKQKSGDESSEYGDSDEDDSKEEDSDSDSDSDVSDDEIPRPATLPHQAGGWPLGGLPSIAGIAHIAGIAGVAGVAGTAGPSLSQRGHSAPRVSGLGLERDEGGVHMTGSQLDLSDVPTDLPPIPNPNTAGTSRFRGVTCIKSTRLGADDKWKAQITVGGTKWHLGLCATEEEAGTLFARAHHKLFERGQAPGQSRAATAAAAMQLPPSPPALPVNEALLAAAAALLLERQKVEGSAAGGAAAATAAQSSDAPPPEASSSAAVEATAPADPPAAPLVASSPEVAEVAVAPEPAAAPAEAVKSMDADDSEDEDDEDDEEEGEGGGEAAVLSPSKAARTPAERAARRSAAKDRRARKLAVLESAWLEAGHMERLLLATQRAPRPPLSDAWAATGLEPPEESEEGEEEGGAAGEGGAEGAAREGRAGAPSGDLAAGQQVAQKDPDSGKLLKVWPSGTAAATACGTTLRRLQEAVKTGAELAGFKWEPFGPAPEAGEGGGGPSKALAKARADGVFQYAETRTYKGENKLREYQLAGLNWMLLSHHYKRSCILADEMGLGKTVQVVSFLEHLVTVDKLRGPFLVVVPLSTLGHWQREFASWTDLGVCLYHDAGKDMRALIRAFEWYYDGRAPPVGANRFKFNVLVTTYDEVIKDVDQMSAVPWRGLVVDEAHRLKGVNSKLLDCLNQILPLGVSVHGTQHRLLMTGTPLQNNTKELWSLLNFIEPAKFPSLENFQETYEAMNSEYQVRSLQQRLAPHLLRRVKEDVATDIPAKYETVIDVELTTIQKQYYRAIFEKNMAFLARAAQGAAVPKLMNIQMELRKCCNHPHLIEGVEAREAEKLHEQLVAEGGGAFVSDRAFKSAWAERCLLQNSGKLVLLDKLLPKLKAEGHKVLIFSQMTRILNVLEEFCEFRGHPVERLDGSITGNLRQAAIDRFNTQPDSFVFLLSTRAGGVGINLTAADTCIIFDSDWNPQNDVQAQARCHRIGQTKEVMVYRLITRKSFEAEMFERASLKLGLERAVLGTRDFDGGDEDGQGAGGVAEADRGEIKLSQGEMEKLLRQGAYALLEDADGDAEAAAFVEGDIDAILEQRSRVRKIEGGRTAGWLNKQKAKGTASGLQNQVSKTSFTAAGASASADVAVDDPNFWAKVMPNLKNAALVKDELTGLLGAEPSSGASKKELSRVVGDAFELATEALEREQSGKKLQDAERKDIVDLLLRITIHGEAVGEKQLLKAEGLLESFEGKRRRNETIKYSGGAPLKGPGSRGGAGSRGGKLPYNPRPTQRTFKKSDDYEMGDFEDDDDEDDDDEEDDEDDELVDEGALEGEDSDGEAAGARKTPKCKGAKGGSRTPRRGGGPGSRGPYKKSAEKKAPAAAAVGAAGGEGSSDGETAPVRARKGSKPAKEPAGTALVGRHVSTKDGPGLVSGVRPGGWVEVVLDADKRPIRVRPANATPIDGLPDELGGTDNESSRKRQRPAPSSEDEGGGGGGGGGGAAPAASKGKASAKKKSKASTQSEEQTAEQLGFIVPARVACAEWPAWPEPPTRAALNSLAVGLVDELFEDEDVEDVFGYPVPEETPGYAAIIPEPMDLGAIRDKGEAGAYSGVAQLRRDLRLVVDNCLTFNADGSDFHTMAGSLGEQYHKAYLKAKTKAKLP